MKWNFWKAKKGEPFEEFIGYVATFCSTTNPNQVLIEVVNRANELGLKGKRVHAIQRRNLFDPMADSIWLVGEVE